MPHAHLASLLAALLPPSFQVGTAPCEPEWQGLFGGLSGFEGRVFATCAHDDGRGTALFVGGDFHGVGSLPVRNVARWDGTAWSEVGEGFNGRVRTLAVFDDGDGVLLYAGGEFTQSGAVTARRVASWDGAAWSEVGGGFNGVATASVVHDDGGGPALFMGGSFTTAGGFSAARIARWDGAQWTPLGFGLGGAVLALGRADFGQGPQLFAGGSFTLAGNAAANRIARWDGAAWSPLGSGVSGGNAPSVRALREVPTPTGNLLAVGGQFAVAGSTTSAHLALWNGSEWFAFAPGPGPLQLTGAVEALEVHDSGAGPALYAQAPFSLGPLGAPDLVEPMARWAGGWQSLGIVPVPAADYEVGVKRLASFDSGQGTLLHATGTFRSQAGGVVRGLGRFDGAAWITFPGHVGDPLEFWEHPLAVRSLLVFDHGDGPRLHAAGDFTVLGGVPVQRVARWSDGSWFGLGVGILGSDASVRRLVAHDGGGGERLWALGDFPAQVLGESAGESDPEEDGGGVAVWDGLSWTTPAAGITRVEGEFVADAATYVQGGKTLLVVTGSFQQAGELPAASLAAYDGRVWNEFGGGLVGTAGLALLPFGADLVLGGQFTSAGGVSSPNLARWDGSTWAPLGGGANGAVHALALFDDGQGPRLFAGGEFTQIGGSGAFRVAAWDGLSWSSVGGGATGPIFALHDYDGPAGRRLIAAGDFATIGAAPSRRIAQWDGQAWLSMGIGIDPYASPFSVGSPVLALASLDDGLGDALFAGGSFHVSPGGDGNVARWGCPLPDDFQVLVGCFGNTASLTAAMVALAPGAVIPLSFRSTDFNAGFGGVVLLLGVDGLDAAGCGLPIPDLGELLLGVWPLPLTLAVTPAVAGLAAFQLGVPADPSLVGKDVHLQALHVDVSLPGSPAELSRGLRGVIGPP